MKAIGTVTAEHQRLAEDAERKKNWKRWGPYLAERQWGTVREDYSPDGMGDFYRGARRNDREKMPLKI